VEITEAPTIANF